MCVQCNVCGFCAYAMRTKIRCAVPVVSREYIGLVTRTSVLGFLDQVILNPVCSATATETSLNIAILHVASSATCRERIIKALIRLCSLVLAFIVSHAAKSGLFRVEAHVHSRYDLRCSKRKQSVTRSAKPTTRIAV